MIRGHKLSFETSPASDDRRNLQDTIQCVAMSLPEEFYLSHNCVPFEEESTGHDNWIIALHLMLQRFLPISQSLSYTNNIQFYCLRC
jgi:hypothetical protein